MKEAEVRRMAALAGSHFWFRGTRRVILDWLLRAAGGSLTGKDLVDVGCGPGTTLRWLPADLSMVGVDLDPLTLEFAQECETGAALLCGDACHVPLQDASMDLALCLDILEHIPKPEQAAAHLHRILRPGGSLIATVPAYAFLFSSHDRALGHHRRYRRGEFRALLEGAGLEVRRISYYNFFLFPPVALVRLLHSSSPDTKDVDAEPESDLQLPPAPLNRLLEGVISSERFLLRHLNLPFGVSLIAWAVRPE